MTLLEATIIRLFNTAIRRGCNPASPVRLELVESEQEDSRKFVVVCSYTEPTFSEIPYNVLWLVMNPGSLDHKSIYRRVSHITDGKFRGTWELITAQEQLFAVDQYYRSVVETPADLGLDVSDLTVPHATKSVMGIVLLDEDEADGLVVSDTDPRMADPRYPNPHDHPDYPRSMIKINDSAYAILEGNSPKAGDTLYLTRAHPTDRNAFFARWGKLSPSDVEWASARLERLVISLPGNAAYMEHNSSMDLIGTAIWTDRTEVDPAGLAWEIEANAIGVTIDPATGVVTAPKLQADVDLQVTVSMRDPVFDVIVKGTYTLRIVYVKQEAQLTSIEITGATDMLPGTSTTFGVVGVYDDGSRVAIVPDTFVSGTPAALGLNGYVGTAKRVPQDTMVTLTATKGALSDTHEVRIRKFVPVSLDIRGPAIVDEHTEGTYTVHVSYNDGTTEQVTPLTFTIDNQHATINGMKVAAGEVATDEAAKLSASFEASGVTVNAQKSITLRNVSNPPTKRPQSLNIIGPATVNEKTSQQYAVKVVYDDGSIEDVKPEEITSWTALVGTITATGLFTAPDVTIDTLTKLTVNATVAGYPLTKAMDVTIKAEVLPTGLIVSGAASLMENTSQQYTVKVQFSDGTSRALNAGELTGWTVSGTGHTISASGLLAAGEVAADTTVAVTAKATVQSIALTGKMDVLVRNVFVNEPSYIVITGPTTVNENTDTQFQADVYYLDGAVRSVALGEMKSWTVSGFGSMTVQGMLKAGSVTADSPVTITLTVLIDGKTLTDTHNVTIKDIPAPTPSHIVITGATSVNEGSTSQFQADVYFTDGTVRAIIPAEMTQWSVDANGTIDATGRFTAAAVVGDQPAVLTLKATVDGKVMTDTHNLTVKDSNPSVLNAIIKGTTPINENTSSSYTAVLRLSNNTEVAPTKYIKWEVLSGVGSFADPLIGTLVVPKVMATQITKIKVTVEYNGTQYSSTLDVTVTNLSNIMSMALVGPASINEGLNATYKMVATMEDGTTADFTTPTLSFVQATSAATISGQKVTAAQVSADTTVKLRGTVSAEGKSWTADLDVVIKNIPVTLSSIAISGPTTVEEKKTGNYTCLATMSDGSTKNVTPSWSIQSAGGLTGLAISSSGVLTTVEVTANTVITLAATYSEGGVSKTATYPVTITNVAAPPAGGVKFGIRRQVASLAEMSSQAFLDSLTTKLSGNNGDRVTIPANSTTGESLEPTATRAYIAWPKATHGWGYFITFDPQTGGYGFAGSWDGALDIVGGYEYDGPAEVTIGGVPYVVYRTDFPFDNMPYIYEISYHSTDKRSGIK